MTAVCYAVTANLRTLSAPIAVSISARLQYVLHFVLLNICWRDRAVHVLKVGPFQGAKLYTSWHICLWVLGGPLVCPDPHILSIGRSILFTIALIMTAALLLVAAGLGGSSLLAAKRLKVNVQRMSFRDIASKTAAVPCGCTFLSTPLRPARWKLRIGTYHKLFTMCLVCNAVLAILAIAGAITGFNPRFQSGVCIFTVTMYICMCTFEGSLVIASLQERA